MKLITFDFEGTLVDHQWKVTEARGEVLKLLADKGIDRKLFEDMNYAIIYNLVREREEAWGFNSGQLSSRIDSIYDVYDLDAASRYRPVDGLHHLLKQLGQYKTALVSNSGRKGVAQSLSRFGLSGIFGLVLTRNDVRLMKPSGEGIDRAVKWAGVAKQDVIHIGDSVADIHAARDAGVKVGIVLGGQNKPEALRRENPDIIMERLSDLPDALRTINF